MSFSFFFRRNSGTCILADYEDIRSPLVVDRFIIGPHQLLNYNFLQQAMISIYNHKYWHKSLILLAVLLSFGCSTTLTKESETRDSYDKLYSGSNKDKTANEAAIAAETPEEAIARGDEAYGKRQYDIALYEYVDALKLNGGDSETLNKVGDIHFTLGDLNNAEEAYKASLQLDKENQHALQGLGLIQLRARKYPQAKANLSRALELNPDLWNAHNGLGMIADIEGNYPTATAHYYRALELNPRSAQVLNNLGYSEYLSGNWHAALMHFVQAVNSDPDYVRAWYNIGLIYTRQGDYEDAFDAFRNVLTTPQSYNDIGYLSMIDGHYDIAETYFQKAVKSSPSYYLKAHENIDRLERLRERGPLNRQTSRSTTAAKTSPLESQMYTGMDTPFAVAAAGTPVVTIAPITSDSVVDITFSSNANVVDKNSVEIAVESSMMTDAPPRGVMAEPGSQTTAAKPEGKAAVKSPEANNVGKKSTENALKSTMVTAATPQAVMTEPGMLTTPVKLDAEVAVKSSEAGKSISEPDLAENTLPSTTTNPDTSNPNSLSKTTVSLNDIEPDTTITSASKSANTPIEATAGNMASRRESIPYTTQGEQADYRKALAMVRDGQFEEAAESFNLFLKTYPDSSYADNANYWIGETYYVTRDFEPALETFTGLVEKFPDSPKVPDTRLKIGYIHYEQHDWPAAHEELSSIVSTYPDTEVAQLANARLMRMEDEGH
jgi:tol-pal system protein YbgF